MSLYKQKGSDRWWFKFQHKGVMYRETTGTTVERDAQQIENVRKAAVYKGEVGIFARKAVPTVREFQKRFLQEVASHISVGTLGMYEDSYNRVLLFPAIADAELTDINFEKLEAFTRYCLKTQERATVNHNLRVLRRALRLAAKLGIIPAAPQIGMLANENKRDFVLSPTAEKKYLEACPSFLRAFAVLDLETGCRLAELIGLRWTDIDWQANSVYVAGTKTPNSRRTLPLTTRAVDTLKELKRVSQCDHILSSPRWPEQPARRNGLQHAHEDAREAAGLPSGFVLHSLRHTWCTRLAESGCDVYTLMRLAGHANLATSQRYIHSAGFSTSAAVQGFENFTEQRRMQTPGIVPGIAAKKVRVIREKAS
jgi:integrase